MPLPPSADAPAPKPAEPAPLPAPATLKKGFRLEAVYDDGFGLRTPDRSSALKLGASTQLDTRFYAGNSVAPHSFDIRRARIDLQATLFKRLGARIQAALEDGTPYIRNAFADLKVWDFLHIRGGQMKVPFSSSWLAFDNQVDFLERAALTSGDGGQQIRMMVPWKIETAKGFKFKDTFKHKGIKTYPWAAVWNVVMVILIGLSLGFMAEGLTDLLGIRLEKIRHFEGH